MLAKIGLPRNRLPDTELGTESLHVDTLYMAPTLCWKDSLWGEGKLLLKSRSFLALLQSFATAGSWRANLSWAITFPY